MTQAKEGRGCWIVDEEGKWWSKLCRLCGQPMKPKGVKKKPDEYDHAQGCPYSRLARAAKER